MGRFTRTNRNNGGNPAGKFPAVLPKNADKLLRSPIFADMEQAVALFVALGNRLATFGQDEATRRIIRQAVCGNEWFTQEDILRSVAALRSEMLDRERLQAWLAAYRVPVAVPRNVLVVMAGNIPLVGFFDLLCVMAAGHRCLIKPSSKDRVLMDYVMDELLRIDSQARVGYFDDAQRPDAVIATGSDDAERHFRTLYAGIPALLRGSRQSVAVLSGDESPEQLAGLADDVFAYCGLGCRNVSLLFLPRGCKPALVPPPMPRKYRNNYLQQRALLTLQGHSFVDCGEALLVPQREFPSALSCIAYAHYDHEEEVAKWLTMHDRHVQCVVSSRLRHSRRVDFGKTQSPTLTDYPDERDVMRFLSELA